MFHSQPLFLQLTKRPAPGPEAPPGLIPKRPFEAKLGFGEPTRNGFIKMFFFNIGHWSMNQRYLWNISILWNMCGIFMDILMKFVDS